MTLDVATMQRLSALLDRGIDLAPDAREAWLAGLAGDDAALAPTLRELLARAAAGATADFVDRVPAFTVAAATHDAPEASALRAGDLVGAYRLQRLLGRGGMGEVWLAERSDGQLKRSVALKLPHVSWAPGLAERFARERDILAGLEHPHIARLYDAGVDAQGRPFMALEYVEGQPLDTWCNERALPVADRVKLLLQVADAVAFAHSRLVLHRDLKPGNLLVTADGQVRLLDFGIAKLMAGEHTRETALTQAAGRALTLDYASPEQIRGEPIGTASDVYSLAVVAFELLAGTRPYRLKRQSAAQLEEAITSVDAPLASDVAEDPARRRALAGDLDAILNKALKKDAAQRYPTVDALAQDWRRHLAGQGVAARPDTLGYRLSRFVRQQRVPLAVGAAVVAAFALAIGAGATTIVILALLAGLGAALWQARRAREQARRARVESRTAEAVKRFLLDIFEANNHKQADPRKAQQTTARELLDIGLARIATSLRDEPEARISVLETLSAMYWELGLRTEAMRLQREVTDLARTTFGATDLRFARIALTCMQWFEGGAHRHEIPALADEVRAALAASDAASATLQGTLAFELSAYYRYESLPEAIALAEQAVALLAPTAEAGDMSNVYRAAGRARIMGGYYDLAERHYRSAVALWTGSPEGAAWSVNAHAELAEALFKQGRFAEALDRIRLAAETSARVHGDEHRWTLVVRMRLSGQLFRTGRIDEALAVRAQVEQALAQDRPEYDTQFRADLAGYMCELMLERGRPDLALPLAEEDLADLRQHFPRAAPTALRCVDLAEMHAAYGRYGQARALADEAGEIWARFAADAARPSRALPYALASARVWLAQRDPHQALAVLSRHPRPEDAASGRFDYLGLDWAADFARTELALGHAERARDLAGAEIDTLRVELRGIELPAVQARLHHERGCARLALRDFDGAREDLRMALALRRRFDDAASLYLAEVSIALARCLLATAAAAAAPEASRRAAVAEARALLDDAQRIHAQHPPLGAHLTEPLREALAALEAGQ